LNASAVCSFLPLANFFSVSCVQGQVFIVQSSDTKVVRVVNLVKIRPWTFTPCSAFYDQTW